MCNCFSAVEKEMASKYNTKLKPTFLASDFMSKNGCVRASIVVEKVDKTLRGPARPVFASFCPFCGTRYIDETQAAAPAQEGGQGGA